MKDRPLHATWLAPTAIIIAVAIAFLASSGRMNWNPTFEVIAVSTTVCFVADLLFRSKSTQ